MLQKDEIYLLILLGSLVFVLIAFFLLLFVLYFAKRKKQIELEKQIREKQFTQELLQAKIEIQEQTMQYASREVHDNFGQIASLIKLNLSTLEYLPQDKLLSKIQETRELSQQLIADIRSLSLGFGNSNVMELGFVEALNIEVQRLHNTGLFNAHFISTGNIPYIGPDILIILFRMVQESINNIVKHSGAKNISIVLSSDKSSLTLKIKDDGAGFDVEQASKNGGQGMRNLAQRAALIHANITMESVMQKGSEIIIYLPL